MRIDTSEKQKLDAARAAARPRFNRYLSKDAGQSYWENMEVLYWPFYSFEECLAAFGDDQENRSSISMLSAMERVARRVSGIPDFETTPIDPRTRRSVLARYAIGTYGGQMEDSLASGPQIFSEVFVRYQGWARNQVAAKLLPRQVLQQLDDAGPLPRSFLEDSQFMAYLVQSRDYQNEDEAAELLQQRVEDVIQRWEDYRKHTVMEVILDRRGIRSEAVSLAEYARNLTQEIGAHQVSPAIRFQIDRSLRRITSDSLTKPFRRVILTTTIILIASIIGSALSFWIGYLSSNGVLTLQNGAFCPYAANDLRNLRVYCLFGSRELGIFAADLLAAGAPYR